MRRLLAKPDAVRPNWGGRRRASLTPEEEYRLLAPWVQVSSEVGILLVSPLRAALAQKLGRPVVASVVYRLLARHGWRKVAPDPRHPKSDPQIQEEWKKTSRNTGSPLESGRGSVSPGAHDVSGRSALWAQGANSPLLVAQPGTSGGQQRVQPLVDPASVAVSLPEQDFESRSNGAVVWATASGMSDSAVRVNPCD